MPKSRNSGQISSETRKVTRKAIKYINSEEGKEEIREAMKTSSAFAKDLQDSRRIDPDKLHDPMTI